VLLDKERKELKPAAAVEGAQKVTIKDIITQKEKERAEREAEGEVEEEPKPEQPEPAQG
jgi:hypothetical protein